MEFVRLNFAFLWKYVKPFVKKLWFVWFFLVLIVATGLVEPYLYKLVVDNLVVKTATDLDLPKLINILLIWAGVGLINLICFASYRMALAANAILIEKAFVDEMYQMVLNKDLNRHLSASSGEMMRKVDKATDRLWTLAYDIYVEIFPSWFTLIAMVIFAFYTSWQMTLVTLALVPIVIWIFIFGAMKTHDMQRKSSDLFTEAYGMAHDAVANIFTVKSFVQEEREHNKFMSAIGRLTENQKKISMRWAGLDVSQQFIQITLRFVIFAAGIFFIYQGSITVGTLVFFLAISGNIYGPLQNLGNLIRRMQESLIRIDEARKIYVHADQVLDNPKAKELKITRGSVFMDNVTFKYETRDVGILKNATINFEPGQITALVGHSGAGKSTVTSLINRFYNLTGGKILIDDQDIAWVTQNSLRKNVGMVMQDNTMFNGTIEDNIRYAKPTAKREEVISAAKKAHLHEFITGLPLGYKTKVGEKGLRLSGGERQRVAIARAILKNPPILILDEATSALDSVTEREIQKALEEVMKGRTSIVIAHRLSTVRKANKIVVMDKGKVVQQGTHEELMKKPGVYQELVELQTQGFLAE